MRLSFTEEIIRKKLDNVDGIKCPVPFTLYKKPSYLKVSKMM